MDNCKWWCRSYFLNKCISSLCLCFWLGWGQSQVSFLTSRIVYHGRLTNCQDIFCCWIVYHGCLINCQDIVVEKLNYRLTIATFSTLLIGWKRVLNVWIDFPASWPCTSNQVGKNFVSSGHICDTFGLTQPNSVYWSHKTMYASSDKY